MRVENYKEWTFKERFVATDGTKFQKKIDCLIHENEEFFGKEISIKINSYNEFKTAIELLMVIEIMFNDTWYDTGEEAFIELFGRRHGELEEEFIKDMNLGIFLLENKGDKILMYDEDIIKHSYRHEDEKWTTVEELKKAIVGFNMDENIYFYEDEHKEDLLWKEKDKSLEILK